MAKIGQIIKVVVAFQENDGRSKHRPCLVLDTAIAGDGTKVYLCAPFSSKVEKNRGEIEVVLTQKEALLIGLDKDTVLRCSQQNLVAVLDKDILFTYGNYRSLPDNRQRALQNAARAVGCSI